MKLWLNLRPLSTFFLNFLNHFLCGFSVKSSCQHRPISRNFSQFRQFQFFHHHFRIYPNIQFTKNCAHKFRNCTPYEKQHTMSFFFLHKWKKYLPHPFSATHFHCNNPIYLYPPTDSIKLANRLPSSPWNTENLLF